jgi:hypothetical protein
MDAVSYIHLRSGEPLPALIRPRFKAVIVAEDAADRVWRSRACEWLVRSGCLYFIAWGDECEAWHDSADDANIAEFEGGEIPDNRFVMTTWHSSESLSEALWFAAVNAHHPTVDLNHVVVIHVAQQERGDELLNLYRSAADE